MTHRATPEHRLDDRRLDAYLDRIGVARPAHGRRGLRWRDLQLGTICAACRSRTSASTSASRSCSTTTALFDKLVDRRRGGFCYELNGVFAALLRALGYARRRCLAAACYGAGGLGPPFDHLALRVDAATTAVARRRRLRRVQPTRCGSTAGPTSPTRPAPSASPDRRRRPRRHCRTARRSTGSSRARGALRDFGPICCHQTSPDSHFTRSLVCSLLTDDGRMTLRAGP